MYKDFMNQHVATTPSLSFESLMGSPTIEQSTQPRNELQTTKTIH